MEMRKLLYSIWCMYYVWYMYTHPHTIAQSSELKNQDQSDAISANNANQIWNGIRKTKKRLWENSPSIEE